MEGARPRLGYVPALDGVRGVAIAAVVLYHFYGLPGGFLGVDLFFVLSGFLITTLLLEDGRLGRFYKRRARRLLPALIPLLILLYPFLGWQLVAKGGLYGANFMRAFARPDPLNGTVLDHMWSLAEEEQFYLVWPLVLGSLVGYRRGLKTGLAVAFVVLVGWRIGLTVHHASRSRIYFGPDTHADGLVLGCLAALIRPKIGAAAGRTGLVAVLVFFAAAAWTTGWLAYGLPVFEVAAVLVVAAAADGRLPELTLRPLVWLGLISYSLYLWHQPVHLLDHGHSLIGLPVAMLLAVGSYRLVEKPFRQARVLSKGAAMGLRSSLPSPAAEPVVKSTSYQANTSEPAPLVS